MTKDKEDFYNRLADAPHGARGFFETVGQHFERRNDVRVHHTSTSIAEMRQEAHWPKDNGKAGYRASA